MCLQQLSKCLHTVSTHEGTIRSWCELPLRTPHMSAFKPPFSEVRSTYVHSACHPCMHTALHCMHSGHCTVFVSTVNTQQPGRPKGGVHHAYAHSNNPSTPAARHVGMYMRTYIHTNMLASALQGPINQVIQPASHTVQLQSNQRCTVQL